MAAIPNSILHDTKQALGLADDYTPFDPELILHINSSLSDLNQLGIGPDDGFEISDEHDTWSDLFDNDNRLNNVKSYVYLCVKRVFDPPATGYALTALKEMIEKAEWRLQVAMDEIKYPPGSDENWPPEEIILVLDGNG